MRFACLLGSLAAFRRLYTCSMSCAPASAAKQAHAQALAQYSAQLQCILFWTLYDSDGTSSTPHYWVGAGACPVLLRGLIQEALLTCNRLCLIWLQPSLASVMHISTDRAEVGMPAVLCSPFTGLCHIMQCFLIRQLSNLLQPIAHVAPRAIR